jgi:hypothetical protein
MIRAHVKHHGVYSYALHEGIPRVVDEYVGKAVAQQVRFDIRIFSEYNLNNNWILKQPTPKNKCVLSVNS